MSRQRMFVENKPGRVLEELPLPYEQYAAEHREKTGIAIPATLSEEIEGTARSECYDPR